MQGSEPERVFWCFNPGELCIYKYDLGSLLPNHNKSLCLCIDNTQSPSLLKLSKYSLSQLHRETNSLHYGVCEGLPHCDSYCPYLLIRVYFCMS